MIMMQITFQDFLAWEKADKDVIKVKRLYIDITGDIIAGLLLSQIVYWHLPGKNNFSKLRIKKQDQLWLAKGRNDWWEECRITARQFDRALKILINKGLVEKKIFKFNGTPTTHIRLIPEKLMEYVNSFLGNREQKQLTNEENKTDRQNTENLDSTGFNEMVKSTSPTGKVYNIDYNIDYEKEKISVSQTDRQTDTSNFLQSKTNNQLCKKINTKASNQLRRKINKPSLEEEIQKLGATKEQIEQARQCVEERKKAGVKIWNTERYFLAVLKSLIKFEKITKPPAVNYNTSSKISKGGSDRQTDTSNFSQSKANNQLCKKINKPSLEEKIQKLGATPEQVEQARQRMEEYKKATGTVIRHVERYFLSVLKNLIEFEKITKKYTQEYERDREYHRKIFEALLMS
ncbi:hypothetical protein M1N67_03710 [Peptococcaceae bacterium]|nr:hypothetical protein [Peptococcaceae bacterium]